MTRQEQQINYWANMLNESVRDDYSDDNTADLSESDVDSFESFGESIAGMDGEMPVTRAKTRNRTDKEPEWYIGVDFENETLRSDYTAHFITQSLQLTHGVNEKNDFRDAAKFKRVSEAVLFAKRVLIKYPHVRSIVLCCDDWSWAPVTHGGSNQRRYKEFDVWLVNEHMWKNGRMTKWPLDNTAPVAEAEIHDAARLDERRMAGPAAARNSGIDEIADMRAKLNNGVVEFEFWKHDPDGGPDIIRHAVGTTSEAVVPTAERRRLDPSYDENLASYRRRESFIIWFWDLEKNAVRCFNTNRFERIINVQENPGHVAPNVERIGDIFIHRDEDQNAAPVELTPDVEERINDEIENDAGEALAGIAFGDQNAAAFNPGFGITRAANGEPVLKIIINKQNCTDNDAPYELKLNELRQEIRRRWNVDVKRAEVTGNFRFV